MTDKHRCSIQKLFREVSEKSQGKSCDRGLFQCRCFPVNYVKFFIRDVFQEHPEAYLESSQTSQMEVRLRLLIGFWMRLNHLWMATSVHKWLLLYTAFGKILQQFVLSTTDLVRNNRGNNIMKLCNILVYIWFITSKARLDF